MGHNGERQLFGHITVAILKPNFQVVAASQMQVLHVLAAL